MFACDRLVLYDLSFPSLLAWDEELYKGAVKRNVKK